MMRNNEQTGQSKPRPSGPMRSLRRCIGAVRRACVIRVFKFRSYWLGPDTANTMFQTISKDLLKPLLKALGVEMGDLCDLNTPIMFIHFNRRSEGRPGPAYNKLKIGARCHVGRDCFFDLWEPITLGDRAIVAMRCVFLTHRCVGPSALREIYPTVSAPIVVGEDTYIGAGTTILHGVTLGRGCVVAAGSVVRNSFGDHCMIAGVPARKIKDLHFSSSEGRQ